MMPLRCCSIFYDGGGGEKSKETNWAYFFVVVASVDADAIGWMLSWLSMVGYFPPSEVGCSGSRLVCHR